MSNQKKAKPVVYTKQQILVSKRFAKRRDLVGALLNDDEQYTIDQVDAAIVKFLKGKVK